MLQQRITDVDENMSTDARNINELKADLAQLEAAFHAMSNEKAQMENDLRTYK